jgi:sporulation protein YlmC with PRC-barrel domain
MITYRNGMPIFTSEGKQVGHVTNLVLTPFTNKVTHLVVGRGFLFTEEKVMPESWISHNDGDRLILKTDQTQFDSLPSFKEREYVPAPADTLEAVGKHDEVAVGGLGYPSLYYFGAPGFVPATGALAAVNGPLYVSHETKNIPENATVLNVCGRVLAQDGQHVGQLEQVVTNDAGSITHFVLSEGLLFKTHKLVPAHWIDHVEAQNIHLAVVADTLLTLPDYSQM